MIRKPAVAGLFYPSDPVQLNDMVGGFLRRAGTEGAPPKALIVPHAGLVYSGEVAASGYVLVKQPIERVVLLGPAHRYPFRGLAAHGADEFATPLGNVRVDREAIDVLLALEQVHELDVAHTGEHSLEVHLPFLQALWGDGFALVPLVVGEASPGEVAQALDLVWGGPETLIVISSDLSHFHPYDDARRIDKETAQSIERLEPVDPQQACGYRPIGGLLALARRKNLHVTTIDLRNSGDTAGGRGEVVGYGAFAVSGPG